MSWLKFDNPLMDLIPDDSPRRCGTCRHFEPSTSWQRGWCRNSLIYAPGRSQVVQQVDLNCSRGQGDFWESAVDSEIIPSETAGHANVKFSRLSRMRLFAPAIPQLASAQGGGTMMFSRSSGGSGGDEDYGFSEEEQEPTPTPRNNRSSGTGGNGGNGGRQRTVQFEPEERYWTEYLRIALPVIGLLLMLGVFWYWAQQLISDDGNTTEPTATEQTIGSADIVTPTVLPATPEPTQVVVVPTDVPVAPVPATNAAGTGTQATPPPETSTGTIAIGTNVVTNDAVNLRPDASTAGDPIIQLKSGTSLKVIGGPSSGENYTWWQVEDADGNQGWVISEAIDPAP